MKIEFTTGVKPTLQEVLDYREQRVMRIKNLLALKQKTVLCFKLNIPGPIKNNDSITELFNQALSQLQAVISLNQEILEYSHCGPEFIATTDLTPLETKKLAIQFEETNFLTRLCDVDVYSLTKAISRADLNMPARQCFMCSNQAKVCSRSRKHSVKELLDFISASLK